MKSQKKKASIRDFFSPVPRKPQDTAQLQDARSAGPNPFTLSRTSNLKHHALPHSTQSSTVHSSPSASKVLPAPTTIDATGPDAQPPTTSQTSINSGVSKRIVSNGEQVVLNSDSDSDSLPELDFGGLATGFKTVTPVTRSKRATQHDDDALRKPEKKVKSKKHHFDHVVETAQKTRELERVINEHKADLENEPEEVPSTTFMFDEDALVQAVHDDDDPDKAHRLFLAMQRTNATHAESVFHLFNNTSKSSAALPKFPADCLPEQRWTTSFRDTHTRDQAFLTGFAYQVFRLQDLPQELASWMIDQICLSRSDILDSKYLEILVAHDEYLQTLLDRNRLDDIFRKIGADVHGLQSKTQISPSSKPQSADTSPLPRSLKSIAKLLEKAAPWLRPKSRSNAFYVLCHVCMDDRVIADPDVLSSVQDATEAILCNFVDNRKLIRGVRSPQFQDELQSLIASQLSDVLPHLISRVTHPVLQRNLVCAFPVKSPLAAYFRRHLALSFLVHPESVDIPLTDPQMPAFVHRHLQTSESFRINKGTHYGFLTARMTLLDVAIGPGLSTVPYQPLVSPAPSPSGSSPIMAPVPGSDDVKEFNKEVDALVQHIKFLGNSIMEAGAVADLTILDAKDSVERLCSRLEHAVRIGGKKMHDVFGDEEEEKQLKVTDIFRKVAKARKSAHTGGIFDDDDDDGVDDAAAAQLEAESAS